MAVAKPAQQQSQDDQQPATTTGTSAQLEALDCSWCAVEQGRPMTESPDICASHTALVLAQAAARRARREARV